MEQQRQQEKQQHRATAKGAATKEAAKRTNICDLPPEIICEIAKYNPASSAKLGLTCKAFNKILEKELKENQKAFKHNENIYRMIEDVEEHKNDIAVNSLMMPGWITEEEYRSIMKNLNDSYENLVKQRKCINCKRMSPEKKKGKGKKKRNTNNNNN